MFLAIFLGLLVAGLLLYLLNFLNEGHTWHILERHRRSDWFQLPSDFPHRDLDVLNYQPRILAVYDFVNSSEQQQLLQLASGLLQQGGVCQLAPVNHHLVRVLQKRVANLCQVSSKQLQPLEMGSLSELASLPLQPSCLCVVTCFLGDSSGALDFSSVGLAVQSLPGLALWWYNLSCEGQPTPLLLDGTGEAMLLRIQVRTPGVPGKC
jgi:hypothetical protein